MSRTPRAADLLEVQRYVDGELSPEALAAFEARLRADPSLLAAVEAARAQRRLFADDPAALLPKPLAVADAILEQVRRLPRRQDLMRLVEGDELAAVVAATGRRWLIAAALLLVAALLFGAGLIRPSGGEAHARDAAELRQLDEIYRNLQDQGKGLRRSSRSRSGSGSGR